MAGMAGNVFNLTEMSFSLLGMRGTPGTLERAAVSCNKIVRGSTWDCPVGIIVSVLPHLPEPGAATGLNRRGAPSSPDKHRLGSPSPPQSKEWQGQSSQSPGLLAHRKPKMPLGHLPAMRLNKALHLSGPMPRSSETNTPCLHQLL